MTGPGYTIRQDIAQFQILPSTNRLCPSSFRLSCWGRRDPAVNESDHFQIFPIPELSLLPRNVRLESYRLEHSSTHNLSVITVTTHCDDLSEDVVQRIRDSPIHCKSQIRSSWRSGNRLQQPFILNPGALVHSSSKYLSPTKERNVVLLFAHHHSNHVRSTTITSRRSAFDALREHNQRHRFFLWHCITIRAIRLQPIIHPRLKEHSRRARYISESQRTHQR